MEEIVKRYLLGLISLDVAAHLLARDADTRFLRVRPVGGSDEAKLATEKVNELFRRTIEIAQNSRPRTP